MTLQLTHGMPEIPNTCLICGTNPTDDDGNQLDAIFAEGVDVDWGNSVYICWECGNLIADLLHRVPREFSDKVEGELEALKERYSELQEEHERLNTLVQKIRDGGAAQKALRGEKAA